MTPPASIGIAFAALAVIGIAYQVIALAALCRFFSRPALRGSSDAPLTILKPLHGAEPELSSNLATFLSQDYSGAIQMVCGVGNAEDSAIPAVAELRRTNPEATIELVTGLRPPGANAKIGNLCAMLPAARHDILVISDSDMAVQPSYLTNLIAELDQPGVGAVTCLYTGRGDTGLWSQVSAAAMSYTGMPNMVMALATSIAQPCLGSTIAIRRTTLNALGGFERFADELADDYAIGEAVAALGLQVVVPPILLTHACAQRSLAEVWRQHLRWSVTIRGVAPMRHAGSGVTHALSFALITVPFLPMAGAVLVAAALLVRLSLALVVNRISGVRQRFIWLVPIADLLEFAVFLGSFAARTIDWRGRRLTMADPRRIAHPVTSTTEIS